MPKHEGWLTLFFCGLPLFGSILVGVKSWLHLRHDKVKFLQCFDHIILWAAVFTLIFTAGWVRAVNQLPDGSTRWPDLLARAQLAGAVFVETPEGWLPRDEAEQVFRRQWCKERDLSLLICGAGPYSDADPAAYLPHQRMLWCGKTFKPSSAQAQNRSACGQHFVYLDQEYINDWQAVRRAALSSLPKRDMAKSDLRWADLRQARLEGAKLAGAQLEGANLDEARLEGAYLRQARLEGASLLNVRLEGADLWYAGLEWADLWRARLEEASLSQTRLQGAKLGRAHLVGADLQQARLDQFTSLTDAVLQFASVKGVDFSDVAISQEQINASFGDASVILPKNNDGNPKRIVPRHWPVWDLDIAQFLEQWRLWRADPANYQSPLPLLTTPD